MLPIEGSNESMGHTEGRYGSWTRRRRGWARNTNGSKRESEGERNRFHRKMDRGTPPKDGGETQTPVSRTTPTVRVNQSGLHYPLWAMVFRSPTRVSLSFLLPCRLVAV